MFMLALLIIITLIITPIYLLLALIGLSRSNPTLTGVVVSLVIGMLPLYLILCFFGIMGEPRNR